MPDPIVLEPPPTVVAHAQVTSKGFDDPAFLQTMDKAFQERAAKEKKPEAPAEQPETEPEPPARDDSTPASQAEPPKIDRPPTPRKASEWAVFHDAKVKVEKERDELKAKLDSFNGFDPKEYENTKTANKTLEEKLQAVALEKSDKFQRYFTGEAENIRSLVKSAMGDKADKAIKLLDLPDSDWRTEQLEALSEDLTPLRRARLERAISDMDKLNIERQKVIENSNENWKKLQESEQAERASEQERVMQAFDREMKDMADATKGIAPFQTKEGDSAWNNKVKERTELARKIFIGDVPIQEKARHAAFASAIPEILQTMVEGIKENQRLTAELEKLRGSEPGLETGPASAPTNEKEYEGLTYGEIVAKMVEKAGAFPKR